MISHGNRRRFYFFRGIKGGLIIPGFWKALLIILMTAVLLIIGGALPDDSIALNKTVHRDRLIAVAKRDGVVKVIVRLDVPSIRKLSAISARHKATTTGMVFPDKAAQADKELAVKISSVSQRVLSRLKTGNTLYKINRTYSSLPFLALDVSEEALKLLESSPEVISITEDRLFPPILDGTTTIIGADSAWAAGYTGAGWYVAILDTGILSTHEFFSGKTIVEACYSADSHCPNGQTSMTGAGAAAHHPSTYYGWDHGTHVAGIAVGNNGSLYGVAKDADIIAIQVFSRFEQAADCNPNPTPCLQAYTSDIIAGLAYVYSIRGTYNIASVNMSLGGGKYSDQSTCDTANADVKTAIDNLRAAGIATIIASGNNGYCDGISAPACISSAIAVGATTDLDVETTFNNWHEDLLDLFAPGNEIYSSTGDSNSSYESWDGTSMSAPHVAGTWAILKQKDPSASVTSLLSNISSTGVLITTICSGQSSSKPRIQVDSALSVNPPTAPSGLSATTISSSQIDLSWADNSNNETGFKIERKTGASGTYSQIDTPGANVTSYSDTGLSEAITYYYRVRAYNGAGESDYSNEASAATLSSPSNNGGSSGSSGGDGGGGGCFIATAAYGSPLHPYVKALREFRNKHLLTNPYGKTFVELYYKYSPAIAEVIKDSEFLKAVTRVILTPVVMFVVYPYISLVVFIAFLLSSIIAFRMVRRQRIRV